MRPPPPSIDIDSDDVGNVIDLSHKELLGVPCDQRKWRCGIDGCNGFTTIKDYGVLPLVYWRKQWIDLSENIFFCSRHWKIFKAKGRDESKFTYKPGAGINHLDK